MIRPILFNQFSAKANMAGIKTQTRRERGLKEINKNPDEWSLVNYKDPSGNFHQGFFRSRGRAKTLTNIKCPYGNIGNVLWVRETWAPLQHPELQFRFKADHKNPSSVSWKPSIHMPKDAARQWLRITDIRVERLHSISEEDAIAEGITGIGKSQKSPNGTAFCFFYKGKRYTNDSAADAYGDLLNLMHGAAWCLKNPWLWVIEYEVLSTTGKPSEIKNLQSKITNP